MSASNICRSGIVLATDQNVTCCTVVMCLILTKEPANGLLFHFSLPSSFILWKRFPIYFEFAADCAACPCLHYFGPCVKWNMDQRNLSRQITCHYKFCCDKCAFFLGVWPKKISEIRRMYPEANTTKNTKLNCNWHFLKYFSHSNHISVGVLKFVSRPMSQGSFNWLQ